MSVLPDTGADPEDRFEAALLLFGLVEDIHIIRRFVYPED